MTAEERHTQTVQRLIDWAADEHAPLNEVLEACLKYARVVRNSRMPHHMRHELRENLTSTIVELRERIARASRPQLTLIQGGLDSPIARRSIASLKLVGVA